MIKIPPAPLCPYNPHWLPSRVSFRSGSRVLFAHPPLFPVEIAPMAADGYWRYAVDPRDQAPTAPLSVPAKRPRPDYPEVGGGLDYYGYYPRPEERLGHLPPRDVGHLPPRDVGHLPPRDTEYDRYYHNGVSGFGESARPVSGGFTSHPGFIGGAPEKMLPPDASNTLFVEGLPPNCTRREVSHIFRPFVGFKEVRLVNKESKRAGGDPLVLCFVDFSSSGHAAVALDALQGYKFDEEEGNNLRLQFARFPGASRSGGGPRSKR